MGAENHAARRTGTSASSSTKIAPGGPQLLYYVAVMDNLLAHVDRRAVSSRAIFTTSIARTTPAQNPRGLSRMIFFPAEPSITVTLSDIGISHYSNTMAWTRTNVFAKLQAWLSGPPLHPIRVTVHIAVTERGICRIEPWMRDRDFAHRPAPTATIVHLAGNPEVPGDPARQQWTKFRLTSGGNSRF